MSTIRIGLLGCGNVGGGFVRLLASERARIRERVGIDLQIHRILVRDAKRCRDGVAPQLLTQSAIDVIDGGCEIVVELVGGVHSAGAYVRRAIEHGCDVVTANKALLASRGEELFGAAAGAGTRIGFEASVCGAVPVVRVLQHAMAGDRVESIVGILNGTCNYILSRIEDGATFDEGLRLAQERGFAEADPTLDISGADAAQKLRILASLAFDVPVVAESVAGIDSLEPAKIERARAGGNVWRLVAEAERHPGGVTLRVEPRELDANHVLARVRDEENAVVIRGRASGELRLSGKGAGAMPTASAVLAVVFELA
jgi:homoserine dehydrogenase